MRVLVVSATFPPVRSGGADYTFRLCQRLAESGHDVHVVTSTIENVATDPSIRVSPVMRTWSWADMPHLLWMVRRDAPDVVNIHFHGHIYNDHPMITFAPTFMKRVRPGVRVVTHIEYPAGVRVYTLWRPERAAWKVAARLAGAKDVDPEYGSILRDSDRIIVLSDAHRSVLSERFEDVNRKSTLIPPPPLIRMSQESNGTARRSGRDLAGAASCDFVIAYFGYLYPGKGIETLFQAVSSLADRPLRLVLVGGGNDSVLKEMKRPNYVQELRELAGRLGLSDKIVWSGYYPSESDQASLYLRGADACVLPFDAGVYLNNSSFAAAAAHGLPIITTRGEVVEVPFKDSENVLFTLPKDSQALSSAIERLMNSPALQQRLRTGALDLAREWFSWESALKRTIEAFEG
jgi:glycosyltransferase involved in cell wall biosynthesis